MDPDITPEAPAAAPARAARTPRDAQRARQLADERVATAQRVADAVADFHRAADRIDAAQSELADATAARLHSLRQLRTCGLSVNEIVELTGLSSSRVQNLVSGN